MTWVTNMTRNVLLGVLHIEPERGTETFIINADIPLLHYSEGECVKAGFLYYHFQCFGIPSANIVNGVKKEPIMINGETLYYVYIQIEKEVNVGVV